jgi:hypothetical protein
MPVVQEEFDAHRYKQIEVVEFLEFIARMAVYKFDQSDGQSESSQNETVQEIPGELSDQGQDEKLTLHRMIELMLDRLFDIFLKESRIQP